MEEEDHRVLCPLMDFNIGPLCDEKSLCDSSAHFLINPYVTRVRNRFSVWVG